MQADVCVVGAGLCGVLLAEKLSERCDASILMVEGGRSYSFETREARRQAFLDYQNNPWPGSHELGHYSAVGGKALHWGGHACRFTEQDFRDWPITYQDLEAYYCEAEERMGVSGEGGPSFRSKPYPMPPLPLPYGMERVKEWVTQAGLEVRTLPYARNSRKFSGRPACTRCDTCYVCPTGAKYSPDFTLNRLLAKDRVKLLTRRQVVRLKPTSSGCRLLTRDLQTGEESELTARHVVLAGGTVWTSVLLMASDLANSSGLLGRGIVGHPQVGARFELDQPLYPGQYGRIGIQCDQFTKEEDIRFELRFAVKLPAPRLRDSNGGLLLGDAMLNDWRDRLEHGQVDMSCYFEVPPEEESQVVRSGDLAGWIKFKWSSELPDLRRRMQQRLSKIAADLTKTEGRLLRWETDDYGHHPAGGCRMGLDPKSSVCDPWGRIHQQPRLWVAGAPLFLSGGCTSSSLTFAAVTLRTADQLLSEL